MARESNIEWTDATWNPWYGCHKVSPGCAYCYMDRWAKRSGRDPEKVTRAKDATFYAPLYWKEPRRIFTCSLSDFFIEEADPWRDEAWSIIARASQHTFLVLTKRIERVKQRTGGLPLPANVWLGVSAENQRQADERIPKVLQIPAAKRFVSIEPMLGPIQLQQQNPDGYWPPQAPQPDIAWLRHKDWPDDFEYWTTGLDWVIVGGESGGPGYRQLHYHYDLKRIAWVQSLRDQCQAASVPFFFKQWGGRGPRSGGSILDGREWKECPEGGPDDSKQSVRMAGQ